MKRHGLLLFRTYLVIVGGLVASAALIDYGYGRLQDQAQAPPPGAWAVASLDLIERRLLAEAPEARESAARELARELTIPVKYLAADAIVHADGAYAQHAAVAATHEVFDERGRAMVLRHSPALGASIQVGPLPDATAPSPLLDYVPQLFIVVILVLVGVWLWPLIRDVDLLSGAARAFAADYRQPMSTRGKATTLKDLAGAFDEMSARIRDLIQGQKDLTNALSHEIRTPLARIKFAIAVVGPQAPAELQAIGEDVREIDRLIATMLDLARLDYAADSEVDWQLAPAAEWLAEAAAKCLPGTGQRVTHRAPPIAVRMDPALMELALSNLLVNACRYARARVSAELVEALDGYELRVDDDGPGIADAERDAVFKAFTRLDDSRSRVTGGFGLGLAIVARIAALHGGRARVERSPLGGARIAIAWPSAPTAP